MPECLRELQGLVYDTLAFLVIADFGVSLQNIISLRNGRDKTYSQSRGSLFGEGGPRNLHTMSISYTKRASGTHTIVGQDTATVLIVVSADFRIPDR